MKAKVINVRRPTGDGVHSKFAIRRTYVDEVFIPRICDTLGLEVEVFPAITHHDTTTEGRVVTTNDGRLSTRLGPQPSYVYVFLSHLALWSECAAGDECMLIFEDDARLPDSSVAVVRKALADYEAGDPGQADMLYLQAELPYAKEAIRDYNDKYLEPANGSLMRVLEAPDTSGSASYALRPAAARQLVRRAAEKEQNSPDFYFHVAHKEGYIGIQIAKDFRNTFMLHEVWEPYNHTPE